MARSTGSRKITVAGRPLPAVGVRPQLTFLFIVSHKCRAYEIVKWELNKFILCDMSAFEQEYSQVCLSKLLAVKQCIFFSV